MELPEFLTINEFGDIRIRGRRIGLYHIVVMHEEGAGAAAIAEEYELAPELVEQVLQFCNDHRSEVDAYVREYREEGERLRKASKPIDWNELRRRMAARGTGESA
jgi:uncharacterized protein (DUF433 family)